MEKKGILKNQKGFTLIEIIAVLVILGILAAVAIPKYMGLQEESRNAAAKGQIAEVKGRLSQAMAKYMLQNNGVKPTAANLLLVPVSTTDATVACATPAGTVEDFAYGCVATTTTTVTITVTAVGPATPLTTLATPQTGIFYIGT